VLSAGSHGGRGLVAGAGTDEEGLPAAEAVTYTDDTPPGTDTGLRTGRFMALPHDVKRFIAKSFEVVERSTATELCESATLHNGSPASPRLIRCALIASKGSLDQLRSDIAHLKIDYRDVIVAGEYVPRSGQLVRVRNLDEPFPPED
jgi:hypothetical protein